MSDDDFIPPNPKAVVPRYETDLRAVGPFRTADPSLVAAEKDWTDEFTEQERREAGLLP